MKAFSGFMAIFALGMFANAVSNQWAFDPAQKGTKWALLDVLIGLALAAISYFAYVTAERAELSRSIGTHELYRQEQERRERSSESPGTTSGDRPDGT